MERNESIAIEILNEIDRARSGSQNLDELESKIWRLLERADDRFPRILAGRIEGMVNELRALRRENLSFSGGHEVDEDRGADLIYNEVTGALGRFLG